MCKRGEVFWALESMVCKIFFDLSLDKKSGDEGKGVKKKAKAGPMVLRNGARLHSTIRGVIDEKLTSRY